jgi:hypothetical protein
MALCSFKDCGRRLKSKGLCSGHYAQQARGERLRPLQLQYHGFTESKRFLQRIKKGRASECWEWTGARMNAAWHGQWRSSEGKHELAHRAAWRLFVGPIPDGLQVLHRCDNPVCVNPSHLFLGTQADNCRDMWAKNRANPQTLRGEKHGMSKLNAPLVREIRSSVETARAIAARLGISPTTVYDVRNRKLWKHIP